MSETVSVFVSGNPTIEECRNAIEKHLQILLVQRMDTDGHLFEGVISGVWVTLFDNHGLDDDCGIEFTQFPVEIDFTRYARNNSLDWNETIFFSLVVSLSERLSEQFRARCIVVKNLQQIVRSFGPAAD
ncbi:hypothetical protein [Singulisphaera acidiphila]|uniref:Uncharacterized protein n=1 Tax=Singulisphaera acidiphila (strain ATCC BAA-1392 / DSM 18658 / VKM B-2454 / MOB10) TaxID=886293 RepID=L0DI47_SINAD|nr:hypothetical protein [Singulisphaera acidiphila]AGA28530.1 hypothetical protein Sinac_4333 [Singulisphaera acidiphila DSM 18658]